METLTENKTKDERTAAAYAAALADAHRDYFAASANAVAAGAKAVRASAALADAAKNFADHHAAVAKATQHDEE